jgi:hypothetical protein
MRCHCPVKKIPPCSSKHIQQNKSAMDTRKECPETVAHKKIESKREIIKCLKKNRLL